MKSNQNQKGNILKCKQKSKENSLNFYQNPWATYWHASNHLGKKFEILSATDNRAKWMPNASNAPATMLSKIVRT